MRVCVCELRQRARVQHREAGDRPSHQHGAGEANPDWTDEGDPGPLQLLLHGRCPLQVDIHPLAHLLGTQWYPFSSSTHTFAIIPIKGSHLVPGYVSLMRYLHTVCVSTHSLFSCSSVLDSMLFKSTDPQDAPIQDTLLNDIVNPLRRS